MRLVLATGNKAKLRELGELLAPFAMEVVPLSDFSSAAAEETGLTFIENAILKARFAASVSGLPSIADDSGLEVDALSGRPGIHSARYAGPKATDAANLAKLLVDLHGVPDAHRTARYRCALAYMRHAADPAPIICQAHWDGRILRGPRGSGGFGYDPVFQPEGLLQSAAELSPAEKHAVSHRGKALRMLVAAFGEQTAAMRPPANPRK
jgi:XTP/dITP diphosphohydrolase